MRASIKRDNKLRNKFAIKEQKYNKLKSIFENRFLNEQLREFAGIELKKNGGLISKVNNRCVLTGRSRGVLRKYKVSRITFKELASSGYLVGIKKSSW